MARLAGCSTAEVQKDRLGVARQFAREHELIVVLKGHRTLVVQPDGEAWVNTTGNPGMSTGGTGDILTGMVAALIAQNRKQRAAGGLCRRASAWARGGRDARDCRRTFDGCDRSAARMAGCLRARAENRTREVRGLGRLKANGSGRKGKDHKPRRARSFTKDFVCRAVLHVTSCPSW